MSALSPAMEKLLTSALRLQPVTMSDGSIHDPGLLVSGREYATAEALERRGLGTLRYQGPAMGWFLPLAACSYCYFYGETVEYTAEHAATHPIIPERLAAERTTGPAEDFARGHDGFDPDCRCPECNLEHPWYRAGLKVAA